MIGMPKQQQVFTIFVASPSDVKAERDALEDVVQELNQTIGRTLAVKLELLRWEISTHPAFGADPQALVSEQLGDDYDIFIGILWHRFGTPTPRAESGTREEFDRAHQRFSREPESVEIMLYFKDAPVRPSEIDAENLRKVKDFRLQVESQGLVKTFTSTEEFARSVRMHLTGVVQSWEQRSARQVNSRPKVEEEESASPPPATDSESELPGFLDLIETSTENYALVNGVVEKLAEGIREFGSAMVEAGERVQAIEMTSPGGPAEAKRAVNALAEKTQHFAARLRADTPVLRETFARALMATQMAAVLLPEFAGDPTALLNDNITSLRSLEQTLQESAESLSSMRSSVEGLPRVTTHFNRARANARQALEELEGELHAEERLVAEARKLLEDMLGGLESSPQ
jgi:hypothetical protein